MRSGWNTVWRVILAAVTVSVFSIGMTACGDDRAITPQTQIVVPSR